MGCDIHEHYEVRRNGKWELLDAPTDWRTSPVYIGRNYRLFSILADVRNGYGFAGVPTGAGYVPISQPRDLPKDVTDEVRKLSDEWDIDGHSHSYVTLRELLDYDWAQTTTLTGMVGPAEFAEFLGKGAPPSWCGDVSGRGVKYITNDEMRQLLIDRPELKDAPRWGGDEETHYYTRVHWGVTYAESAAQFHDVTLPYLKTLAEDPADVRLVFWFDN